MKEKFINGFIDGYTTMELCNLHNFTGDDVCEFFKSLSQDDFKVHRNNLEKRIKTMFSEGYSVSAIATKTFVARSIVSKFLCKIS